MLNIALRRIQGDRVVLESADFNELVQRAKRVEEVVIEEVDEDLWLAANRPLRNPTLITFPFNWLFSRGISGPDGKVISLRFLRGSPQAVLAVWDSPPRCTLEDVNALSQEIEQGKRSLHLSMDTQIRAVSGHPDSRTPCALT